jgi:hypothetical protein
MEQIYDVNWNAFIDYANSIGADPSGRSFAGIVGSNPTVSMNVSCEYCVFCGRGLCVGLVTRPEEPYRVWCVCVLS